MKKTIIMILTLVLFATPSFAGMGRGTIMDITVRNDLNVILVRVSNPSSQPSCATWTHTFAAAYDSDAAKGMLSLLLTAMSTGETIRLKGTGSCYSGTSAEEFTEVNLGSWDQ